MVNAAHPRAPDAPNGSRMRQKKPNTVAAVDVRSILQLSREWMRRTRARIRMLPDRQKGNLHHDDAQQIVEQTDLAQHEVDGHDGDVNGEHDAQTSRLKARVLPESRSGRRTKAARLQMSTTPTVTTSMTIRLLRSMIQKVGWLCHRVARDHPFHTPARSAVGCDGPARISDHELSGHLVPSPSRYWPWIRATSISVATYPIRSMN